MAAKRKTKAHRPSAKVTTRTKSGKCACHKKSKIQKAKEDRTAQHKGKAAAVKKAKQAATKKPCRC